MNDSSLTSFYTKTYNSYADQVQIFSSENPSDPKNTENYYFNPGFVAGDPMPLTPNGPELMMIFKKTTMGRTNIVAIENRPTSNVTNPTQTSEWSGLEICFCVIGI